MNAFKTGKPADILDERSSPIPYTADTATANVIYIQRQYDHRFIK